MYTKDEHKASEDVYLKCVVEARRFKDTLNARTVRELALAERIIARLAWLPYLLMVIGFAVGLCAFAGVCASGASETHLCFCTSLPALSAITGAMLAYVINARQFRVLVGALRIRKDLVPLLRTSCAGDQVLLPILRRLERHL